MPTEKSSTYEISPEGYGSIILYLIISISMLGVVLFFALYFRSMVLYISLPFILLLSFWAIVYIPYRLYLRIKRPIDTITFGESGIIIENKKVDLLISIPWKTIIEFKLIKRDADDKPEEFIIRTSDKEFLINLKLYHTFFTTTETIWNKISVIFGCYNSSKNGETFTST